MCIYWEITDAQLRISAVLIRRHGTANLNERPVSSKAGSPFCKVSNYKYLKYFSVD